MRLAVRALAVAAVALCAVPAAASAASKGKLVVSISAPRGVPGTVLVKGGKRFVAAKPTKGRSKTVRLTLPARRYSVAPQLVTFRNRLYVARATVRRVRVRAHRTVRVNVRYRAARAASRLHPTSVTRSSVSLTWSAPKGTRFALRRAAGGAAPTSRRGGVRVATHGNKAVDRGLAAGRRYAYALFTRSHGRWSPPLTVVVGTAPPAGSTAAAYVAAPGTLLVPASGVRAASATGSGVRVRLAAKIKPPVVGTAIVLPRSASLAGGFLGRITNVAPDGTVTATAAGLSDAFEYYDLDLSHFSSGALPLQQAGAPTQARRPLSRRERRTSASLSKCLGGSASQSITLSPSLELGGYMHAKVDTFNFLGAHIPKGASLDMAFTATATGAVGAKTSAALKCGLHFTPVMVTLTETPVPISFYFTPEAELSVSGGVEVSNVGVTATAGVHVAAKLGLTSGVSVSGNPIFSASPLKPIVTANGTVGAKLGGQVIIGPGAGSAEAGVIAGVGGELDPIDATFGAVFPLSDSRYNACLRASAAFSRELNLTAKAWLGDWDVSRSITFEALKGETPYFGSPWYLPSGCSSIEPQEPGDSVLGTGVTKLDDSTTGAPVQWGHLDGFAPGGKTWVLSTGDIADAVGDPSDFASTDTGTPGDADLTAFAGYPTNNAAAYEVKLVPHSPHLHVEYVFASEEYPEYVDSEFNDVMEVMVDGHNCATVPGTTTPVSINTVNDHTNAAYYVDNTAGAAGYHTSMDGLTVPLTCNATVTPGKPVTVKIAVADASDGIYDSAVALLDKGIWAD